jgi:serine protease
MFNSKRFSDDRRSTARAVLFLTFASVSANLQAGGANIEALDTRDQPQRVNRIIVKTGPIKGTSTNEATGAVLAQALSAASGQTLTYSHQTMSDVAVFKTATRMSASEAARLARKLSQQPGVIYAEPDLRKFKALVPNDPRFPAASATDLGQWHYRAVNTSASAANYGINAPSAWDITTGSASIVIAVLDSGLANHGDLAGRTVAGYDMIADVDTANDGNGRDTDPSDPGDWVTAAESALANGPFNGCRVENSSWHGTHVAGTIGAATNNAVGVAGVNWVSKIQPVRVIGKCGGFDSDIAAGIVWAAGGAVPGVPANATPARVINMSLGGSGTCSQLYRDAIAQANALGALVVVASGNSEAGVGGDSPGNCPGVLTVTATDIDGARATYSNYGRPATLSAPGGDTFGVLSTVNAGTTVPDATAAGSIYAAYFGTSMAAPHVSGVASLMLSVRPTLEQHHLAAMMRGTATAYPTGFNARYDCIRNHCGDGIVNAAAAVSAAQACATPPTGSPATLSESCNGDYDGNGVVSSLTDGLIALRLSMGMTGASVLSGATGTCATRTTYDAVKTWSNRSCGTNY